ncbi:phage holin family protein [uncultured Oscillibacter sp.]|uniref:phage holin family protein n=1 Tax=uncultured Oscillibacter sp. TaxID=876091 RepID=UPI00262D2D18|nr:phage holin family protein [uncultured Oscillibacter sp.]
MNQEAVVMRWKLCVSAVLGTLTALWGWFGWLVVVWAGLMLADWLIGSAVAAKDGRWSSEKMRSGAWHKGGMILIVCVALVADWLIGTLLHNLPMVELPFQYGVLLGPLVIVWYVVGELGSLAEHAVAMGAPYPAWLPRILEAGKDAVDKVGEGLTEVREEKK